VICKRGQIPVWIKAKEIWATSRTKQRRRFQTSSIQKQKATTKGMRRQAEQAMKVVKVKAFDFWRVTVAEPEAAAGRRSWLQRASRGRTYLDGAGGELDADGGLGIEGEGVAGEAGEEV